MRVPRFRLRTLMIVVAIVAVALWAWLYIPEWWKYQQAMKTLTG